MVLFFGYLQRSVETIIPIVQRRNVLTVVLLSTFSYLVIYLYAISNLAYEPGIGLSIFVVEDPVVRMFEPGPGRFAYEPIAVIDIWTFRYLFSPINSTIGIILALLVGLNLGLSYVAIVQPKSCGIGTTSGVFASIPAVIAGSACCAPVLLIILGITAGGTLLTFITWLLPVGVLLLIGSLIYLSLQIEPAITPT